LRKGGPEPGFISRFSWESAKARAGCGLRAAAAATALRVAPVLAEAAANKLASLGPTFLGLWAGRTPQGPCLDHSHGRHPLGRPTRKGGEVLYRRAQNAASRAHPPVIGVRLAEGNVVPGWGGPGRTGYEWFANEHGNLPLERAGLSSGWGRQRSRRMGKSWKFTRRRAQFVMNDRPRGGSRAAATIRQARAARRTGRPFWISRLKEVYVRRRIQRPTNRHHVVGFGRLPASNKRIGGAYGKAATDCRVERPYDI